MHKRRASIPSKGWKVLFKSAFKKRKESKIRHGRGENGRKDCRMRTFVYQKERSCHKRRNMMRRLVDQNYRRCQKRERRMKRFANQKVRRWQNHFRKKETDRGQQTISRGKYFFQR